MAAVYDVALRSRGIEVAIHVPRGHRGAGQILRRNYAWVLQLGPDATYGRIYNHATSGPVHQTWRGRRPSVAVRAPAPASCATRRRGASVWTTSGRSWVVKPPTYFRKRVAGAAFTNNGLPPDALRRVPPGCACSARACAPGP